MTEQKNKEGKTSISKASTYEEMSDFWSSHDLTDYWDEGHEVEFKVNLQQRIHYYPVALALSDKMKQIADSEGVAVETLLNRWIEEKVNAQK